MLQKQNLVVGPKVNTKVIHLFNSYLKGKLTTKVLFSANEFVDCKVDKLCAKAVSS